jgi:putative exosortase-associated protein (TIGR04073 family)
MKTNSPMLFALLITALLSTASIARAQQPTESYGDTVSRKISSGIANLTLSVAEVPKNIIIVSNQTNVLFGLAGGLILGGVDLLGRTSVGILDLITAPLPTQPIVFPLYVWEDFDKSTAYGPIFRPIKE